MNESMWHDQLFTLQDLNTADIKSVWNPEIKKQKFNSGTFGY